MLTIIIKLILSHEISNSILTCFSHFRILDHNSNLLSLIIVLDNVGAGSGGIVSLLPFVVGCPYFAS